MKKTFILLLVLGATRASYGQPTVSMASDAAPNCITPVQVQFFYSYYDDDPSDTIPGVGYVFAPYPARSPFAAVGNLPDAYGGRTKFVPVVDAPTSGTYALSPFCSQSLHGAHQVEAWDNFWQVTIDGPNAVTQTALKKNEFYISVADYGIHLTLHDGTEYTVCDLQGKLLMHFPAQGEVTKFDPSSLPNGIYLLTAWNGGLQMKKTIRFVKAN